MLSAAPPGSSFIFLNDTLCCFVSPILAISIELDGGFLTGSIYVLQEGRGKKKNAFFWKTGVEGLGPRDRGWLVCMRDRGLALLGGRGQPRSLGFNPPSPRHPTAPGLNEQVSPHSAQKAVGMPTSRLPGPCLLPPSSLEGPLCFVALCLSATCPSAPAQCLLLQEAFLASLPFPFLEFLKTGRSEQHSSYFSVLCPLGVHRCPLWSDIKAQGSRACLTARWHPQA